MKLLWLVVVAVVALAVAIFAGDNVQPVSIAFLNLRATTSLPLIVLISFFGGAAVGAGVALPGRIRLALRVRRLEQDLAAARTAPADPTPPPADHPAGPGAPAS